MKPDKQIIVHDLEPRDVKVWVCGDVHIGDENCLLSAWQKWLREIEDDPDSYVIFLGDLMNCSTRRSVSDIFSDVCTPLEQQRIVHDSLYNLAHDGRILAMVMGNHEWRVGRDTSIDPLYDVAVDLGIHDVYRRDFASVRVRMRQPNASTHVTYDLLAFHGASDLKTRNMANNIEGWDALCTGHTHDPKVDMPAHLCLSTGGKITMREVVRVVGCSWLDYGGYGARAMYLPKSQARPQCLKLKWPKSNHQELKRITVEW